MRHKQNIYKGDFSMKNRKAYYSEFVTCGMNTKVCLSHEPITVSVTTEVIIENINPWDWYVY